MPKTHETGTSRKQGSSRLEKARTMLTDILTGWQEDPATLAEALAFRGTFHRYSLHNSSLIFKQNRAATYVASMLAWNERGYRVKPGEHGLDILVPQRVQLFKDANGITRRVSEATPEQLSQIQSGVLRQYTHTGYRVGTVFDISQTTCPPEDYPKLYSVGYTSDQHAALYEAVKRYAEKSGCTVIETDKPGGTPSIALRGQFDRRVAEIEINDRLQDTQRLDTLIHEMGHALLHRDDDGAELPRPIKELEADGVSIMLASAMGIAVNDNRKRHFVACYDDAKQLDNFQLKALLPRIVDAFDDMWQGVQQEIAAQPELAKPEPATPVMPAPRPPVRENSSRVGARYDADRMTQDRYDAIIAAGERTPYFENMIFRGIKFPAEVGGRFSNCTFTDCDFSGSSVNAQFDKCSLYSAHTMGASFYAGFGHCTIAQTIFDHARIESAFHDVTFRRCTFRDTAFVDCRFEGGTMDRITIAEGVTGTRTQGLDTVTMTMGGGTDAEIDNHTQQIRDALTDTAIRLTAAAPATDKKETVVVNLFAGPGAGKTTCAWEIAEKLKKLGYVVEYVPEYAKELVWDNRLDLLDGTVAHQRQLCDVQAHRVDRLIGKVDFIITDSPVLLNLSYLKEQSPAYEQEVLQRFNAHHNFCVFIERGSGQFETAGRIHSEDQSHQLDREIKDMLRTKGVPYTAYTYDTIDQCVEDIQGSNAQAFQRQLEAMCHVIHQYEEAVDMPHADRLVDMQTDENAVAYWSAKSGVSADQLRAAARQYGQWLSYGHEVDLALAADPVFDHNHVSLGATPASLAKFGFNTALPLMMSAQKLRDIVSVKAATIATNPHGLAVSILKQFPAIIANPAMAMISATRPQDSLVLISHLADAEGRPVILTLRQGTGYVEAQRIQANILTTAYGRNAFRDFVRNALDENRMLYVDAQQLPMIAQLPDGQLPEGLAAGDYPDNIARFRQALQAPEQPEPDQTDSLPELAEEPTVTILFSESAQLHEGQQLPLSKANTMFGELDAAATEMPGYDKTAFRLDFIFNGQPEHYEGRQDFGDGDGDLIRHIHDYHTYYIDNAQHKQWVIENQGEDAWATEDAQRHILLQQVIPYLQLHCVVTETAKTAHDALRAEGIPAELLRPAVLAYLRECRTMLNSGQYSDLPEPPKAADFAPAAPAPEPMPEPEPAKTESDFQFSADTYAIYQLKEDDADTVRNYRFRSYDNIQADGLTVDMSRYNLVYSAPLDADTTLEDIFRIYNTAHPADFKGHSLSVSDVVVMQRGDQKTAHYCDSIGFRDVPEFFRQQEPERTTPHREPQPAPMPDQEDIIDRIKQEISLLRVAEDCGYTPHKTGNHYKLKEHDSLMIYPDTNSYYRFSTGRGGSAIDFLMEMQGMSQATAIRTLADMLDDRPVQRQRQELPVAPEPPKELELPPASSGKYARAMAYLTKTRCIDPEVVTALMRNKGHGSYLYQDDRNNVVFVGVDADGKAAYATRRSTLTTSSFKGEARGSDGTIGWLVDHHAEKLYVTESAIDAMSLMTMRKQAGQSVDSASYLSLGGVGKLAALEYCLQHHPEIREVVAVCDRDEAGRQCNDSIELLVRQHFHGVTATRFTDFGDAKAKDVNEALCISKQAAPEPEKPARPLAKSPKKEVTQEHEP